MILKRHKNLVIGCGSTMKLLNPGLKHPLLQKFKRKSYVRIKTDLKINKIINFADNENIYGPSTEVFSIIKKNLQSISKYPDGESYILKKTIAKFYNINPEKIVITSGVIETIRFLLSIFSEKNGHVVFSKNSFVQYKVAALLASSSFTEVPFLNSTRDIELILSSLKKNTRYIFISNPDNPSGRGIEYNLFKRFIMRVPKSVFIVADEAYLEYSKNKKIKTCVSLIKKFKNLIVLKSFSKVYGLPGLRVGFVISSNTLINKYLTLVMPPFNVSSVAQTAASAALLDQRHLKKTIEKNFVEKSWLIKKLNELNLSVSYSEANFLLVDLIHRSSAELCHKLLLEGILVKDLTNYGFPHHHRITILKRFENKKLVAAYRKLL